MSRTDLYTQLATLSDAQLTQLVALAQLVGAQSLDKATVDNALVKASKPEKFSAKSLKCTKGIPSKVWSAIHHCVVEHGGKYDRKTKVWTFKTIKACKEVYEIQSAYAKEHGKELLIETC